MLSEQVLSDYARLATESGFVVLDDRTLIRVTGGDRHAFLHNFCTADTKKLEPGKLTEAFILNGKGKILGHVFLIANSENILISTVAGQFDELHQHLDKYIIREDVQLEDVSDAGATVFVCGPESKSRLHEFCGRLPAKNECTEFAFENQSVELAQLELAGDGFMFFVPNPIKAAVMAKLSKIGVEECSQEALEIVRVENATPWFEIDLSDANLPQELRRDEQAISFEKGCYLGQETVARIDAIGHVNQFLTFFKFGAKVKSGSDLTVDEKKVGRVTSVVWAPASESWIGLGYLKRQLCKDGVEVDVAGVRGRVVADDAN